MTPPKPADIKLDDLLLDFNNPRFGELYSGSEKEEDLINYLLFNEDAAELANAITSAGMFYPDRPLWVIRHKGKYLVKDGNRRCAAVKALKSPGKYEISANRKVFSTLPVLIYRNVSDVDKRIKLEHTGNLFKGWDRIAKALEVLKMFDAGKIDEATEIDSQPGDLMKLATFYKEAVEIAGDDLRLLLRRGRGKSGGKAIIFERLFRDSKTCGYKFRKSPSFRIEVEDRFKFENYVTAIVKYLKKHPNTTTKIIDETKDFVQEKLKLYGFDPSKKAFNESESSTLTATNQNSSTGTNGSSTTGTKTTNAANGKNSKGSVKKKPTIRRKKLPPGIMKRINEYYSIIESEQPNCKIAMARVTYECVLKYVLETTKYNGTSPLRNSNYFQKAFSKEPVDFTLMHTKFSELIKERRIRQSFLHFDLDKMNATIHNYSKNGLPSEGTQLSSNLMELLEFLLDSEENLINGIDITKLA